MKSNIGKADKVIRLIIGITIAVEGIAYNTWLGLFGMVFIITALLNWCPFYLLFGVSSCSGKKLSDL
jgi:hypothetical protein